MTQIVKEIIEYLKNRYEINESTTNFIINAIDKALKDAYEEGKLAGNGCDCGQPGCHICN